MDTSKAGVDVIVVHVDASEVGIDVMAINVRISKPVVDAITVVVVVARADDTMIRKRLFVDIPRTKYNRKTWRYILQSLSCTL